MVDELKIIELESNVELDVANANIDVLAGLVDEELMIELDVVIVPVLITTEDDDKLDIGTEELDSALAELEAGSDDVDIVKSVDDAKFEISARELTLKTDRLEENTELKLVIAGLDVEDVKAVEESIVDMTTVGDCEDVVVSDIVEDRGSDEVVMSPDDDDAVELYVETRDDNEVVLSIELVDTLTANESVEVEVVEIDRLSDEDIAGDVEASVSDVVRADDEAVDIVKLSDKEGEVDRAVLDEAEIHSEDVVRRFVEEKVISVKTADEVVISVANDDVEVNGIELVESTVDISRVVVAEEVVRVEVAEEEICE